MSVSIIGEKRGSNCRLSSKAGIPVFEETIYYTLESTDKNATRAEVIDAPGMPLVGITASPEGYTLCRNKTAVRREENPFIWDATCEFSSEVDERQGSQDPTSNPEVWIPVYETKFERLQEVVTKDLSGDAIANSAGQPFENGLTISRFIPVWEFYQFEPASLTDEQVIDRNEVVNSGTFKGKSAKTLLLTVMSSVIGFYYGNPRRLTQYSIKYNSREWTHKRLDVGTVYKDGANHKPYLDDDGNVMLGGLDGSGAKVTVGDPPALLEFDMYPSTSFSFLRV